MKILTVFGTRPEAIKMQPILKEFKARGIDAEICVTSQHKELLEGVLNEFSIFPDYRLNIEANTITELSAEIMRGVSSIIAGNDYKLLLVLGDTVSAYGAAVAAFGHKIPIVHIEAGLRTYDVFNPYPEEFYRRSISIISEYNLATTNNAVKNLKKEGVCSANIELVGNTVYDVLDETYDKNYLHPELNWASGSRLILLTTHRRENIEQLSKIYRAINKITSTFNVKILFPMHPNPEVRKAAITAFSNNDRLHLSEPLSTYDFHNIMARCHAILTDSGGIEEEALYFHTPTLVLRKKTERTEELRLGTIKLIGNSESEVYQGVSELLINQRLYTKMKKSGSDIARPGASYKICNIIESILNKNKKSYFI